GRRLLLTAARELLRWDEIARRLCDDIVQANLGLVPTMIERSRVNGVDFGELISEGQLALLRSVEKFDCTRGFKFSTYACRSILTAIARAVALMARYRNRFPMEFDPDFQTGDTTETREAHEDEDYIRVLQSALRENRAELTRTERKILSERFGFDGALTTGRDAAPKTLREIASTFGVTKERVRQIQNRALDKLRTALEPKPAGESPE
ncbi:MAG: sigma-70 family RNA polymerase sigma factor, partial [Planctomycetes bacterium]|nr:sigma-70 family RNA polymerase sigma factor [Planctomycetota bacterium]